MAESTTLRLQRCLDRLKAGDLAARQDLLGAAGERLTRLARKMFRADGRLRRWEETGDVLQGALLRLCRSLQEVTPGSVREFYRLAALQIRRELIDLARHHYGPHGAAAHRDSTPAGVDRADPRWEAGALAAWTELHERIGALPDEQREVFDLVWYQGLTQTEAGDVLGVSAKTIQRRWQAACLRLHEALGGHLPAL